MGSRGQVKLRKILKMLRKCAPGYTLEEKVHLHWIRYRGRRATLPQGQHGKGKNAEIEVGHVRHLARALELDAECVQKYLPQLA